MAWGGFIFAFAAFFVSHTIPVRPGIKAWLVQRFGQGRFTVGYSALSLLVLAWLIRAADDAPHMPLWDWAPWQNLVPLMAMLPVCMIIALSLDRPNPFSFGGSRNEEFDPARPGLVRVTRHPLLLALALWAGAHLLPNGDLAHVMVFGTFCVFALFGGRIIDRKKQRELGETWESLRREVAQGSLFSKPDRAAALSRGLIGLLLYLGLIWLHPLLFGVSPLQ